MLKTAALSELYKAVQDVAAGHAAFSAEALRHAAHYDQQQTPPETLTERESDVLIQAAHGLTNKEIGQRSPFLTGRCKATCKTSIRSSAFPHAPKPSPSADVASYYAEPRAESRE